MDNKHRQHWSIWFCHPSCIATSWIMNGEPALLLHHSIMQTWIVAQDRSDCTQQASRLKRLTKFAQFWPEVYFSLLSSVHTGRAAIINICSDWAIGLNVQRGLNISFQFSLPLVSFSSFFPSSLHWSWFGLMETLCCKGERLGLVGWPAARTTSYSCSCRKTGSNWYTCRRAGRSGWSDYRKK